jgi:type I restriction enzyme, S subunit
MSLVWPEKPLEELIEPDSIITYGVIKPGNEGSVRFVRGGDIVDGIIREEALRTITAEVSAQYKRTLLRGGELLISLVGQPGQVAVASKNLIGANIARQVGLIRLKREIDPHFICYFLRSPDGIAKLRKFTGGSVQQVINLGDLRKISTPIPAIALQRRLVAFLDEAFDSIAIAEGNAKKNLQNAKEFFTNHLERTFGQRDATWNQAQLSTFTSSISTGPFGSLLHKSDYVSNGVPLVNPTNIIDGYIVPDREKLIDVSTIERLKNYVLRENDIVVGRRGEIGRCAVVGPNEAGWVCGTGCFFIRPLPTVRSAFIAHLIRSRNYRSQLELVSTGATMKNLSNIALGGLQVAVPDITQQDRTLSLIELLSEACSRLEVVYEQKLTALDELKKSLLHHAFYGQIMANKTEEILEVVA